MEEVDTPFIYFLVGHEYVQHATSEGREAAAFGSIAFQFRRIVTCRMP